jgi:hypothetical protein
VRTFTRLIRCSIPCGAARLFALHVKPTYQTVFGVPFTPRLLKKQHYGRVT